MGRRRKDEPPPPPSAQIHVRIPISILEALGMMADKKKQSRNTVIVTLLAKALRGKRTTKDAS